MLALEEVTYAYGESVPAAHGESAPAESSAPAYGESAPAAHGESAPAYGESAPAAHGESARAASAARPVLTGVTLSLAPGEIVGISGASASGKTTLLRLAAGRIAPTSGTVTVDGIVSDASPATRRDITRIVSLCHQLPERQLFAKTLADDVAFGPKSLGVTGDELERRVERALVSVGLDVSSARQVSPFELSGGERRRAAIAGALACGPRYLLLEEPTAGLDPASRDMLMDVLADLAASGTAVAVVSHDLELLAAHADRIVVLGPAVGAGGDSAYEDSAYNGSAYDESAYDASAYDESAYDASAYDESAYDASAYDGSSHAVTPHAVPSTVLADGPASEVLADAALLARAGLVQPLLWRLADVLPAEFSPVPRPASGEAIES